MGIEVPQELDGMHTRTSLHLTNRNASFEITYNLPLTE